MGGMTPGRRNPLVHLELHTGDLARAQALYGALCGWQTERVDVGAASYVALGTGASVGGGIVECTTPRSIWLPYVEVDDLDGATDCARELGARVLLEPREGPA